MRPRAAVSLVVASVVLGSGGALPPRPAAADGIMLVQAGAFWMGRDDGPPEEAPLHRVYVRDYWIERHKITNAEFARFLAAVGPVSPGGASRFAERDAGARIHRGPGGWAADPGFERHPAVDVSWFGARDYCQWIGRRLPTEAEWEKAARGEDRHLHPWGPAPPTAERAVLDRPPGATDSTLGHPDGASAYGVQDLLGNAREWTSTRLRPYPYRSDDGREGWHGEGLVVVRGASHDDPSAEATITRRRGYDRPHAAAGHHDVGFRCATSEDLGEMGER